MSSFRENVAHIPPSLQESIDDYRRRDPSKQQFDVERSRHVRTSTMEEDVLKKKGMLVLSLVVQRFEGNP